VSKMFVPLQAKYSQIGNNYRRRASFTPGQEAATHALARLDQCLVIINQFPRHGPCHATHADVICTFLQCCNTKVYRGAFGFAILRRPLAHEDSARPQINVSSYPLRADLIPSFMTQLRTFCLQAEKTASKI
jgi:hypothetical protein